jgi:DNA-binding GntR family transcriptional regulator
VESKPEFVPSNVGQSQLSATVALYLREQIMSGKLKKGDFLRIEAIAKALEISTTPVREGLLLLQSESFVRLMPRRGFVVNSFGKEDLVDLFWAQATVGAELAARAAKKISNEGIAQLQKLHADYERAVTLGDEAVSGRMGHQFHRAINLAAQSPRLALLMGSLTKQLPNRFYASIEGQISEALQYHPIIINAMRVKDSEAVRSLMYRHIMDAADHLIAALEAQGVFGPSPKRKAADRASALAEAPVNGAKNKRASRLKLSAGSKAVRGKVQAGRDSGAATGTGKRKGQASAR